ncbi:MAG: hypothetical protein KDD34_03990 [Bdellovibrionales bacterium]|nr:hypothetical protein [Bdellovibrionales bacterium]
MKTLKNQFLLILLALGLTPSAFAGVHVEPFLGYAVSGEAKQGSSKDDYNGGPIIGGRLGYGMLGFFVAAEYEMGTLTQKSTPEVDVDVKNLGVSLGFEFPILLRIYGTYFFNAKGDASSNEYKGSGTKLGVGYTGLPFVAINFEMNNFSYDEVNGATLSPELETTYYTINVSLPLNF